MMLSVKEVKKVYKTGEVATPALNGVSLEIQKNEFVVILGPSGSGKTTLLNICGGLDTVTEGQLLWNGANISKYTQKQLSAFRRENVGFIFQGNNLLPNLTVLENVESGARLSPNPINIDEIIETVMLTGKIHKFPYQLSGGEQQRVSIARAVAKNPKILYCDEPTGALDEKTGKTVLSMLQRINRELGTTIFMITHNPGIPYIANSVYKMNDGRVIDIKRNTSVIEAKDIRWA